MLMTGETNRGKVVPVNPPELVVLPDGSCIVDGVPTDFVALLRDKIAAKTRPQDSSARLLREFKAMDVDSNGRLGAKEFRRFLEPYNLNLNRVALKRLYKLFDTDNSGTIDYMEFISQICPPNYHRRTVKEVSPRGEVMDKVAMQVNTTACRRSFSRGCVVTRTALWGAGDCVDGVGAAAGQHNAQGARALPGQQERGGEPCLSGFSQARSHAIMLLFAQASDLVAFCPRRTCCCCRRCGCKRR